MATSLPTYTGGSTALVQPTGNPVTDSIIVGSKWGTGPAGTGAAVTFSFPATVALFDTAAGVAGNYNPQEVTQAATRPTCRASRASTRRPRRPAAAC